MNHAQMISIQRIWRMLRNEGNGYLELHKIHNPFGELSIERVKWLGTNIKMASSGEQRLLYWVGCTASYRMQNIARATLKLLRYANVNFSMLGGKEGCCGSVLFRTGQSDLAEKCAEANMEKLKHIDILLTSCAGCYRTFLKDYTEIYGNLPFKVVHISEYLEMLLRQGVIGFKEPLPIKVTYHDPCHLGRHCGIYEPPRNVIKQIPGLEFVEMARNREQSRCCGAGGGLRSAYKDLSIQIAVDRLRLDALPSGADFLVTSCPFCILNLRDAASNSGLKLEILDLAELVCRALGL